MYLTSELSGAAVAASMGARRAGTYLSDLLGLVLQKLTLCLLD
jgi:hypothetical protein